MPRADIFAFLLVGGTHEVVLYRIHGMCPMQNHGAAAVRTVDKPRKDILFCHICSAALMLADVLDDIPCLLVNECFVGVLEPKLFGFRTLDLFLVLEGNRGGFQIDGMPKVRFIFQDVYDSSRYPCVRIGDLIAADDHTVLAVVECRRCRHFLCFQPLGDLSRAVTFHAEAEDILGDGCGFFIRDNVQLGICRVFLIAEGWTGRDSGSGFRFQPDHAPAFLAAVLGIELVHDISERGEVVCRLIQTVHAVVDGNEPHTAAGEHQFRVLSDLKVLSAKSGHILDDQGFHHACFHQFHHFLPTGAVEVGAGVTVIVEEFGVGETFLGCVLLRQ